jgi:hypothetical protein
MMQGLKVKARVSTIEGECLQWREDAGYLDAKLGAEHRHGGVNQDLNEALEHMRRLHRKLHGLGRE